MRLRNNVYFFHGVLHKFQKKVVVVVVVWGNASLTLSMAVCAFRKRILKNLFASNNESIVRLCCIQRTIINESSDNI